MISRHLGTRASALLDGQLPDEEARRAWEHVESCAACQDEVERERWVKSRLACLSSAFTSAPDRLKGSLLGVTPMDDEPQDDPLITAYVVYTVRQRSRLRRTAGLAAMGGGAFGAAVMGVVAFGVPPASAPTTTPPPTTASSNVPSTGWLAANVRVASFERLAKTGGAGASTHH